MSKLDTLKTAVEIAKLVIDGIWTADSVRRARADEKRAAETATEKDRRIRELERENERLRKKKRKKR